MSIQLTPAKKIKLHFKSADLTIYPIIQSMTLSEWITPDDKPRQYYTRLCKLIISQQLSIKAAGSITNRFMELFPNKTIDPDILLSFSDDQLLAVGLSRAKTTYLQDLSQKTTHQLIPYSKFSSMDQEEIFHHLIKVKGIGQWTIDMFLIFALGHEDIYSYGDAGLKRGLRLLYKVSNSPTTREIDQIIQSWSPYKSFGCCALWHSLDVT